MANPIADPFVEVPDTDIQSDLVRIDATPEGAVTIIIDRAQKNNAFNAEVIAALREAFETLHAADGVRVVFVRGEGGNFSAGADLEWMRAASDLTEADNRDDAMRMAVMLKHLYDLPCLTVALVDGVAFGGGAGMVAACDMAIATKDARFAFSEVKLGLIPATVSPYVVEAVGARRARALFAHGRVFDARRALEFGLVDEVVEDAEGLAVARDRLAADMMACAPGAVADAKRLVSAVAGRGVDHSVMEDTARRIARARVGAEGCEGVDAFLTRRKPGWAL
jgi:methylglutaconyl-CoA hydratase